MPRTHVLIAQKFKAYCTGKLLLSLYNASHDDFKEKPRFNCFIP